MCRRAPIALLLAVVWAAGCGKRGPAEPPAPRGPLPPGGVEARQVGARVVVRFTVPQARGSKPSQRPARAELVRVDNPPGFVSPADPDAFRLRGKLVVVEEGERIEPGRRIELEDRTIAELPGGGAGWTVRYAVRVRDGRGRPSALVAAVDLELVAPPPPPENLEASPTAEGIRLTWKSPSPPGKARFHVYRARPGQNFPERPLNAEPLASTEFLDPAVVLNEEYRYVVRTVEGSGPPFRESEASREVVVVALDRFPPQAPAGLVAVEEGPSVRLLWNPSPEKDVAGYMVYRRAGEGDWSKIAGPVRETVHLDRDPPRGVLLAYRVTAVDSASPPNESEPSAPAQLLLEAEPARGIRP